MALMLPVAPLSGGQVAGVTYVRQDDGGIGPTIPHVALFFVKEHGGPASSAHSDANGHYSLSLNPGRYYVLATHRAFQDDTSAPGFVVVGSSPQDVNFFLRKPRITTVLIVRHAEKLNPNGSDPSEPLSEDGGRRARRLREDLLRSGVTAVYSTDTVRTRGTVGPLARLFHLPVQIYSDPAALASTVLTEHRGDVVLVAGHSDTVGALANAFGAQVPVDSINEYDNLYVVSVSGKANVVNLQYAADSRADPPPELTKNDRRAMTLLLVGSSTGGSALNSLDLLHTARKAGVTAVFRSEGSSSLVAPLATALGLPLLNFDTSNVQASANQLISSYPDGTVVVAGKKAELEELIRKLGGSPFPVIYNADVDHLIMVTRFKAGVIRVVPMRF